MSKYCLYAVPCTKFQRQERAVNDIMSTCGCCISQVRCFEDRRCGTMDTWYLVASTHKAELWEACVSSFSPCCKHVFLCTTAPRYALPA